MLLIQYNHFNNTVTHGTEWDNSQSKAFDSIHFCFQMISAHFSCSLCTYQCQHLCFGKEIVTHLQRILFLSRPYCPSPVLRSYSSFNLLQIPRTNFIFGSRSFHTAAPSICNFLPDSIYLIHFTLSGGTSKHTFTKQLLTLPSSMLQHLWFTYVTNGAL